MANWSLHLMRSTDSKSLWNYTLSPGWREEEISVLRLALMKFGVGRWNRIREFLPGKTVAQLNLQTQRLFGQQSLGEFAELHVDPRVIFELNAQKQGPEVRRKNGCIVNTANNLAADERRQRWRENKERFGLSDEQVAAIQIPKIAVAVAIASADGAAARPTLAAKMATLRIYYRRLQAVRARLRELQADGGDAGSADAKVAAAAAASAAAGATDSAADAAAAPRKRARKG